MVNRINFWILLDGPGAPLGLDDCFGDQFGHDVSSEQRDPTVNPKS